MKRIGLFLLASVMMVGLAGCSFNIPMQYTLRGTAPVPRDDAYSCVVRQLMLMGYNIEMSDKATGVVRGAKKIVSWFPESLDTGRAYHYITVTILDMPGSQTTVLAKGQEYIKPKIEAGYWASTDEKVEAEVKTLLSGCQIEGISQVNQEKK